MKLTKRRCWHLVLGGALLLGILTFTPLVTPVGIYEPVVAGMPYTLWMGIVVAICFVMLTLAATHCYPYDEAQRGEDQ